MTSWGNEIEKNMNAVILESRVTFDPRLLGKNVIVFTFKVFDNLGKAVSG